MWNGASLPPAELDPKTYARCRPCDCDTNGSRAHYDDWASINTAAYRRLRTAHSPYPVAIVTGYHDESDGLTPTRMRVLKGLRLLQQGWVSALVLSGGDRRATWNEAARLRTIAIDLARGLGIDIADRIFLEPCAAHTTTNLRNSMRLVAAMSLPQALLVTEVTAIPTQV